ncbi:MAG: CDP-alcohol phosphatidyltransferase [Coriobacteriales bacterium]|jgi:hypothetical protein
MGVQAEEPLDLNYDEFCDYLRSQTRIFLEVDGKTYYLTHTDGYWRAQDCSKLNEKGHFSDCSELVPTLSEFFALDWLDGKTVEDVFGKATLYASIQDN